VLERIIVILSLLALIPPVHAEQDYELLFIGNSHSSANDLPGLVSTLIEAGLPGKKARSKLAPGWGFLADRIDDDVTQQSLEKRNWTHVILQAQKYSSSGVYFYPTDAAEEWIRRVRAKGAEPILFPEWPRRGNHEEGFRVHQLHLSIAAKEPACVAPIGLAWEASIAAYPGLDLHAPDGNHSNPTGALLTAYVLYEVISGQSAMALPNISGVGVNHANQQILREVASTTVRDHAETCSAVNASASFELTHGDIPTLSQWGILTLGLLVSSIGLIAVKQKLNDPRVKGTRST
jgi:hypothetical protein